MSRNFRRERDFWLDHCYQMGAGRRPNDAGPVSPTDGVPVPPPANLPLPLSGVCLVWRWGMSNGYGSTDNGPAHILAFEQSRGEPVAPDRIIRHLCNRPFCIQPAHLSAGTQQDNAEDRVAVRREFPAYNTWGRQGFHWGRADNAADYCWQPGAALITRRTLPELPAVACPHWFIKASGVCINCGVGAEIGHWRPCTDNPHAAYLWPCRCAEMRCYCDFCYWPEARMAGVVPRNSYGQTPPGWRD